MNTYTSTHPVWLKFSNPKIASNYPMEFRAGHRREEHEKECILKALQYFPEGGHLLDLPCGSGRVTRILLKSGYKVTAADVSLAMLKLAQRNCSTYQLDSEIIFHNLAFKYINILDTGFKNKEFDGVVCYRLFHHFKDSEIRKRAMGELSRISHGPILISFFNSFSVSASIRKAKYFIKGKTIDDRVAIKMSQFCNELKSQGLLPIDKIPVRWGISPMWDVIAMPNCSN